MSESLQKRIQARFPKLKVLVVGDAMLDEYWFGDSTRISPEAPVPITKIAHKDQHLGGAANVAESVELFDESQRKAGLLGHELAQGQFEGTVFDRIEWTEGQGGRAVRRTGGEHYGLTVMQGDDDRRQADPHANLGGVGRVCG